MGNDHCKPEVTLAIVDPGASSFYHYNGIYTMKEDTTAPGGIESPIEGYSQGYWWETEDGKNAMWYGWSDDLGTKGRVIDSTDSAEKPSNRAQ